MKATKPNIVDPDLSDCLSNEELASLFESAFASWQSGVDDRRRTTPRIAALGAKPIFVAACVHDGRPRQISERARIVDISADGLGITLPAPVPEGSLIRFAFDDRQGARHYGEATVVNVSRQSQGFRIGLCFDVDAGELDAGNVDVDGHQLMHASDPDWKSRCRDGFDFLRQRALAAYRHVTDHRQARLVIRRRLTGRDVTFSVQARLFRYVATLRIDGRKVASQSGSLRERLRNLVQNVRQPTAIQLRSNGFIAWATLYANTVTYAHVDITDSLKCRQYDRVLTVPLGERRSNGTNGLKNQTARRLVGSAG